MGRTAIHKAYRKEDYNECLRLTADPEVNRNIALVDKATAVIRPKNTYDSYRPKILEFQALCRLKYPGEGSTTITLEKSHKFMFYQERCEKKKCLKGEERSMGHDGSKANKGTFHILRLWNVPYIMFVERSIYYGCGTFDKLRLWNVPYIMFMERSIYYVCGTFHILCLWNVPYIMFLDCF
jgi:hypothetical protein